MAGSKDARPEVAANKAYLDGVAKTLVEKLFGPAGLPWGTTFEDLEELVVQLGQTVSREMLRHALQKQAADPLPPDRQRCPGCQQLPQPPQPSDPVTEPRIVTTRVGDAEWSEPSRYCRRCRRSFFPSVGESGD
jgi:hypothetical protein